MKTFINRFVAVLLSVLLIGSNSVYAQNWSSYQWQPQNTFSQKTNQPKTGNLVESPLADLINQAKDIREALLSDDEKEQPLISQNEFKNIYKEEAEKAYQQAKQEAKNDPQKLKQINEWYHALTLAQEITNQWNKSYKNRFADLPESDDMTETEKELRNFGKLVMDAYDEHKTQNLLDIIEQDFPLYASIGALDTKVRNRARTVLRGIVSGNVSACGNKGFSSGKCNKAIQAAAALAILGDFNDSKRTDLIPLENLLTKAYEGPLAYSAVFLAAAALLTAGQTGAIKSLLVGAATQAKEKQEDLLGGPLFMPSTWINAAQSDGGDSYYLTGYENTFYDISSLDEGSGCVLTDLGEYFAEEAAKGNRNAKEILNAIAGRTIQATPFRANRLMDVQMTPFWAGAIGSGYVVQNMGYRGTALDGNGRSFNVDTVQYWNDAAAKIRQQGTDYTGYIAYQLYKNKKAAVNAWTALYVNNHLAEIVQARNPNKQAVIYEQPTSGQMSKVKTQQIFLNTIGPVGDFVVEWAIGDLALTGGLSTVKGIGKAVKGVKAIRFRNLQRVVKAARAGLTTKLTTFATKAKTPREIKKIQRLRKAVLRSQRRKAARLELYARFSTSFGVRAQIPAPALTGSQAVVKGSRAGKEVVATSRSVNSGKSVVQLPENAHVNTQLGLQKVEAPKSFSAQAKVQAPAQNSGLAGRTPVAPKSTPAPKAEIPSAPPTPKADAVPSATIGKKLSGPLDEKIAAATGKTEQKAIAAINEIFLPAGEIDDVLATLQRQGYRIEEADGKWYKVLADVKEGEMDLVQQRFLRESLSEADQKARMLGLGVRNSPKKTEWYVTYKGKVTKLLQNDPEVFDASVRWKSMSETERFKFIQRTNRKIRHVVSENPLPVAYTRGSAAGSFDMVRLDGSSKLPLEYDSYTFRTDVEFKDIINHLVHENYHYSQDIGKAATPKWLLKNNLDNYQTTLRGVTFDDYIKSRINYENQPIENGVIELGDNVAEDVIRFFDNKSAAKIAKEAAH